MSRCANGGEVAERCGDREIGRQGDRETETGRQGDKGGFREWTTAFLERGRPVRTGIADVSSARRASCPALVLASGHCVRTLPKADLRIHQAADSPSLLVSLSPCLPVSLSPCLPWSPCLAFARLLRFVLQCRACVESDSSWRVCCWQPPDFCSWSATIMLCLCRLLRRARSPCSFQDGSRAVTALVADRSTPPGDWLGEPATHRSSQKTRGTPLSRSISAITSLRLARAPRLSTR